MTDISSTDDLIDVRDIIARIEDLESEQADFEEMGGEGEWSDNKPEEAQELAILSSLMSDLRDYGGDEQWRGDWYPGTLIHETHFTDYCEELVKDTDGLPREMPAYLIIDWEATADNLRVDYSTVEFSGQTFLYR